MAIYLSPSMKAMTEITINLQVNGNIVLENNYNVDDYKINLITHLNMDQHGPRFKFVNHRNAVVAVDRADYHITIDKTKMRGVSDIDKKKIVDISAALAEFLGKEVADYYNYADSSSEKTLKNKIKEFEKLPNKEVRKYKAKGLERAEDKL